MTAAERQQHDALVKDCVSKGKLIEVGFAVLRDHVIPKDAPKVQVDEMRMAFFAGAQHLFGSIVSLLDQGAEPTAADFNVLAQIDAELSVSAAELKLRVAPAGRAQ